MNTRDKRIWWLGEWLKYIDVSNRALNFYEFADQIAYAYQISPLTAQSDLRIAKKNVGWWETI